MGLRSVLITGLAAAAAWGCGGGGSGYPSSPTMGGSGGTRSPGTSASVTIQDYLFSPGAVTIKAGGSVTWTNAGGVTHTVTANDGSFDAGYLGAAVPDTSVYGGGGGGTAAGTYTHTFATAGTFAYHCAIHPSMTGTVTVTP